MDTSLDAKEKQAEQSAKLETVLRDDDFQERANYSSKKVTAKNSPRHHSGSARRKRLAARDLPKKARRKRQSARPPIECSGRNSTSPFRQ
jgi:hypothetical protein